MFSERTYKDQCEVLENKIDVLGTYSVSGRIPIRLNIKYIYLAPAINRLLVLMKHLIFVKQHLVFMFKNELPTLIYRF